MARRPSLTDAGISRPSRALPPPAPVTGSGSLAPSRQGKKGLQFWVDAEVATQVHVMGATMGRTLQDLLSEALADLFVKYQLPRLGAEEPKRAGRRPVG
jgi:hypothetical protein